MDAVAYALAARAQECLDWPGTWSYLSDLPEARSEHLMAPLSDGRALLIGGYAGSQRYSNKVWCYDRATDSWIQRASFPYAISVAACVALSGDRVLVAGGADGTSVRNDVWLYDAVQNSWAQRTSLPSPRSGCSGAAISGNRAIVVGGSDENGTYLTSAFLYRDDLNMWSVLASMPAPRRLPACASLSGDRIVVCGGSYYTNKVYYASTTWRYDYAANQWTEMAAMPGADYWLSGVPLSGDRVMVVGASLEQHLGQVWRYSDPQNSWTNLPALPRLLQETAAAPLGGDFALVVGGWDNGSRKYVGTTFLYDDRDPSAMDPQRAVGVLQAWSAVKENWPLFGLTTGTITTAKLSAARALAAISE